MATLTEFFETEARDALGQLQRELTREQADADVLHRAARALRGVAQMARQDRVFAATRSFEAALRSTAADGRALSDHVVRQARETVEDLFSLLRHDVEDDERDAVVERVRERWADATAAPPVPAAAPGQGGAEEFRRFAAREVAEIAAALDTGLQQLAADPMDREPLKQVLRRQRALLGAARLDELPVVAEILRAVEDLTRVVAKLDVGVKQEWLDIYRVARDALRATVEPLQRNQDPQASHPASRLRHIRIELLERYGSGENAVFATPAQPDEHVLELSDDQIVEDPETGDGDLVSVDDLLYDRDDALRRALELREVITRATASDPQAREAADELFDLIRLALE